MSVGIPDGYTEDEWVDLTVQTMKGLLLFDQATYEMTVSQLPPEERGQLDALRKRTRAGEDTEPAIRELLTAREEEQRRKPVSSPAVFTGAMTRALDAQLRMWLHLCVPNLTPEHDLTPCIELLEQYAERLRNVATAGLPAVESLLQRLEKTEEP